MDPVEEPGLEELMSDGPHPPKKKKPNKGSSNGHDNIQLNNMPGCTQGNAPNRKNGAHEVQDETLEPEAEPDPVTPARVTESATAVGTRMVHINAPQVEKFVANWISTAKYSLLSFLPSFLFEQFRRYSNIFFLTIALLQQIPDVSPTGRYTTLVPLIFILTVSACKEIIEDIKRHRADSEINNRESEVLNNGQWEKKKWKDIVVGDFVKVKNEKFFPADLLLYASSEPQGLCYIETSNLDGETNLKVRQGLSETAGLLETKDLMALTGVLECELPNRNLYDFAGKLRLNDGGDLAIGPDQILLRGAKLQNTTWIFGQVVYTGHETKLMKNSTAAPLKRSTVDKLTNVQIIMLFIILILVGIVSAIFSLLKFIEREGISYNPDPRGSNQTYALYFLYNVLTFVILYNNLIPISLTVTLEVVRFIQALFINWDPDMYHEESDTPAMARTSNLNEELGQVRYIFSDKTGTLTRNIMEFKGCTVGGKMYNSENLFEGKNELIEQMRSGDSGVKDIRDFLILLSVCHTVIPDYSRGGDDVEYHAASPDERALVYGARQLGYVFETRTPNYVEIDALGKKEKFEILNVLEFTSTRKRMSVIVRGPEGFIRLYCKGADSVIYERLKKAASEDENTIRKQTHEHLEEFATQGLRTLCVGMTDISPKAYEEWRRTYHKASTAIHSREEKLEEAADLIEKDLQLLGATAIEDKLQDHVPETIASLIKAGISVWVLTGDKQETAINIGYSCRLLNQSMELIILNRDTMDGTRDAIADARAALSRDNQHALPKESDAAIIIDGKTLKHALTHALRQDFLEICCSCRAVICCRASPIQKAEIVEYVTKQTGATTLAIGDGANDVAMIQKAHVGIGISGQEGLQAACASDYAIAQFSYLTKLLFVHGAWNYDRMCKLIFYSYYKNICLYIVELWYAIYSAWSGQIIFERWTIGFYNMLFTCMQPIAMGVFDRYCSAETRLRYPQLYRNTNNFFSFKIFLMWLFNSLLHSLTLFYFSLWLFGYGVIWQHGKEGGYLVLGNFIYTYVVIVVSLKSGIETKSWCKFTHISIWGSIICWIVFLTAYSYIYAVLPLGSDITGIAYMVFSTPCFYIGLIFVPVVTLLPDILKKVVENTLFITMEERFRQCEVYKKDPGCLFNQEKHRLSETARLLRNVRNVFRRTTSDHVLDMELSHGYAFSQEEHGVVTQSQLIRSYDTTIPKPEGM